MTKISLTVVSKKEVLARPSLKDDKRSFFLKFVNSTILCTLENEPTLHLSKSVKIDSLYGNS